MNGVWFVQLKKMYNMVFPAVFIPGYLLCMLLVCLDRFTWETLLIIAAAGMITCIIAEIVMIKEKTDLTVYIKKLLVSIAASAAFWLVAGGFVHTHGNDLWGWGWWSKPWGELLNNAILFAPAAVTSVVWLITAKKGTDKLLLVLTNPVTHAAAWWYIIKTLLSCLPT